MITILIACLGVALGSFVNALVWRVYKKEQIANSKQQRDKKPQESYSITKGRSMCPECRHQLAWKDLVPVLSWVALRGRCRYCKKPISVQYPIIEILTSMLLVISYAAWPFTLHSAVSYMVFGAWIIMVVIGITLAVSDQRWMILTNNLVYPFNTAGLITAILIAVQANDSGLLISSAIGAAAFSGLFYLLYQVSSGRWIGGGDVRLALGLGLLLGWQKSILALMLAAYLGTIVIAGLALVGKYHRRLKLPFGPFLLVATFVAFLYGQNMIDWYMRISSL